MATIRITNLKLRTIIGINDWERDTLQDVVINVKMEFDAGRAMKSDNIKDTVDYKKITKKIIRLVGDSKFFLLEALTERILAIAMEDTKVQSATVRVDKPQALRFADSVSLELSKQRESKPRKK